MAVDRETLRYLGWWGAFGVLMCLLPLVVGTGTLRILIFAHFLAMFAMSWDFLSGRTGYISFGHPFLIGIAGYTTAILSFRFGVPIYFSIPAASSRPSWAARSSSCRRCASAAPISPW